MKVYQIVNTLLSKDSDNKIRVLLSMDKFRLWLRDEIKVRNWKQADLARAANLDSAVVSNLINGKRGPGEDTCRAIAHAFGLPPETVFRAAGLLPPVPETDERRERILHLADQLPEEEFEDLIAFIELRIQRSKEREAARAKKARSTATR